MTEHIEAAESSLCEYECSRCGARFGIAGQNNGSDEDWAAEEFYDCEVERHESGECTSTLSVVEPVRSTDGMPTWLILVLVAALLAFAVWTLVTK